MTAKDFVKNSAIAKETGIVKYSVKARDLGMEMRRANKKDLKTGLGFD